MVGYVRRINDCTLKVTIGGVRIGSAKYSRLAQINLKTRIITFSRYAIEHVPERGRRYLVIHELAHVKEASHNKRFWELVQRFEPNYKQVGRALELAFKRNVREDKLSQHPFKLPNPLSGRLEEPKLLLSAHLPAGPDEEGEKLYHQPSIFTPGHAEEEEDHDDYICSEDEFGAFSDSQSGIIYGGSPVDCSTASLPEDYQESALSAVYGEGVSQAG